MSSSSKAGFCAHCNNIRDGEHLKSVCAYGTAAKNARKLTGTRQLGPESSSLTKFTYRPEHKPRCENLRKANNGNPLKKSNPVLNLARSVTMNEELTKLIEFIIIASLNLANGDFSLARRFSINIWATVIPVDGHPAKNRKQKMVLEICAAQNVPYIWPQSVPMAEMEIREMKKRGLSQDEIDKTVSANFIWVPIGDTTSLNYNALKEFRQAGIDNGTIQRADRSTTPYIAHVNQQFLKVEYKDIARTDVDLTDLKATQRGTQHPVDLLGMLLNSKGRISK
ncbi:hypothetical protein GYMLUDRAFT_63906 [Collybiopsis luxurians FD-317 M1]|uniref:Uncharacterized protein n=1 Tax=Collybiopsis luxurians FD-317 M1 TaxID=944289 RepID=A0A0D0C5F0_9AGAR|nr:hypothetical protein GYMLUDRAFT_63906 [Collybiopsis luxurians FD-317 M1]